MFSEKRQEEKVKTQAVDPRKPKGRSEKPIWKPVLEGQTEDENGALNFFENINQKPDIGQSSKEQVVSSIRDGDLSQNNKTQTVLSGTGKGNVSSKEKLGNISVGNNKGKEKVTNKQTVIRMEEVFKRLDTDLKSQVIAQEKQNTSKSADAQNGDWKTKESEVCEYIEKNDGDILVLQSANDLINRLNLEAEPPDTRMEDLTGYLSEEPFRTVQSRQTRKNRGKKVIWSPSIVARSQNPNL